MHDEGQCIDRLLVDKDIKLYELRGDIPLQLIVKGRIASGSRLQCIEEIIDDLVQRKLVLQNRSCFLDVVRRKVHTSALLAQLHDGAQIFGRHHDLCRYNRLLHMLNFRRIRKVCRICQLHHGAVRLVNMIYNAGSRRDDIKAIFALKTLQDNLHMKESQEAAAEAKAKCKRRLRFIGKARVGELEFLQSILQVRILRGVLRINPRIDHGLCLLVAGKRLVARPLRLGHGIADSRVADVFDGCGKISHHSGREFTARDKLPGAKITDLHDLFLRAACHKPNLRALADHAVPHADKHDHTAVGIIKGVKNQRFQRRLWIACGCGNLLHHILKDLFDIQAALCGNLGGIHRLQADDVLNFLLYLFRSCTCKVHLVDDREHVKIVLQRKINVCHRLRLNALRRIHNQNRAVAGRKGTGHFIVKVHVSGSINQIENILLPVIRMVNQADRLRLDGDSALTLHLDIVQHLLLHLAIGKYAGHLDHPVCQGRLPVVNVCHNTEIADSLLLVSYFICSLCHALFLCSSPQGPPLPPGSVVDIPRAQGPRPTRAGRRKSSEGKSPLCRRPGLPPFS